jgi:hypothetical protein
MVATVVGSMFGIFVGLLDRLDFVDLLGFSYQPPQRRVGM